MKKLTLTFALVICAALLAFAAFASPEDDLKSNISKNVTESMKARGMDVAVNVDVIKKLDDPKGFYFLKLVFTDKKKPGEKAGEQYLFSDGSYMVQDFLKASDMSSTAKELLFDYSKKDVDVSGLTPIMGRPGAKNVIVEITDFQCPFCIKTNEYLHAKLKNRNDVVVYVMHFPLRNMHPKAEMLAKIFEAGAAMGKNFGNELYESVNHNLPDAELVEKFASLSGDPAKFKTLVSSKETADKIAAVEERARALDVSSTPTLYINGRMVAGYDVQLMDKAIADFK